MIITDLQPIKSELSRIKEIPDTFFSAIEATDEFDNSLFPKWLTDKKGRPIVFKESTELRNKFKEIFDNYKAIKSKATRDKIIEAYFETNKIIDLCNNKDGISYFELNDLDESIREPIDSAFLYLYNNGLKHPDFEKFVNDNLKDAIKNFGKNNGVEVCPFCGLECFLQLEGQPRLPLDHWLNKDRFPFAAVNFDNLIPIGQICNSNGVKGSKNVLKDIKVSPKKRAFYPYIKNSGISVNITCTKFPDIDNFDGDWDFSVSPKQASDLEAFSSWDYIFNISARYRSYFFEYLIPSWQKNYLEHLKGEDNSIVHAKTVDEFKKNLEDWKKSFKVKSRHAALIYQRFINYLITDAPSDYLVGIVENFKSQEAAGII